VKRSTVVEELTQLAFKNGGCLRPEIVVQEARRKTSPLHGCFEWDDREAASEYRLWQARELLAQYWVVDTVSQEKVRLLLSLTSDRPAKAGYRFSKDVLANPEQRREWLLMAIADLETWRTSYAALSELKPVFAAIARVIAKYGKEEEAA
jgi:hypothetical protein